MAKKKQALSPEERLAAALVPEEEQPYALPDGWKWVYLSGILDVSKEKTEEFPPDTKYVGLENIEKDTGRMQAVDAEGIRSTKNIFQTGNILYGKLRPYLNKHGIAEFDGVCSTDILVFQTAPSVEKELLNRYFDLPQFISFAVSHSKGINLPRVSAKEILTARMPLPPLSEQRRLVARIESLFAKLDAAKEKVQSVLDSHETRKAALLHAAFAGKLTAKWREENNKRACYAEEPLKNFVETQYGYTEKSSFDIAGPHYLRITDIQGETVDWNNVPNCSIDETNYQKYSLHPNDIVVARTGATTGKSYMIGEDIDAVFASYLIRVQITNIRLLPKFLYMFFQSQEYWSQIMELSAGIAQPGVNARKIQSMMICVPSLPEQQEIVRILDRLLAREQRARQAAEETLAAIDRMKQSILARAFRGEL